MSRLKSSHVWVELNRVRLNSCIFLGIVVVSHGPWDIRTLTIGRDIILSLIIYFEIKVTRAWVRMCYVKLFFIFGAILVAFLDIRPIRGRVCTNPLLGICIHYIAWV